MIISFRCQSCNAALKIAESFAGRTIRCPRCANAMQIPFSASTSNDAAPSQNSEKKSPLPPVASPFAGSSSFYDHADSTLNPFEKICAQYEPNPFALSVPLDAPETLKETVLSCRSNATYGENTPTASAASENTKLEETPEMFHREEFMMRREKAPKEKPSESIPKETGSKSPSVNEMIADLLKESER